MTESHERFMSLIERVKENQSKITDRLESVVNQKQDTSDQGAAATSTDANGAGLVVKTQPAESDVNGGGMLAPTEAHQQSGDSLHRAPAKKIRTVAPKRTLYWIDFFPEDEPSRFREWVDRLAQFRNQYRFSNTEVISELEWYGGLRGAIAKGQRLSSEKTRCEYGRVRNWRLRTHGPTCIVKAASCLAFKRKGF